MKLPIEEIASWIGYSSVEDIKSDKKSLFAPHVKQPAEIDYT